MARAPIVQYIEKIKPFYNHIMNIKITSICSHYSSHVLSISTRAAQKHCVSFLLYCIKFMHTHIHMRIYIIHVIVQISLKMKNKWAFRMVNKPNENCTISENNKSNYNYAMLSMYWLRDTSEKNTEEHFENIKIFFNIFKFNLFCS